MSRQKLAAGLACAMILAGCLWPGRARAVPSPESAPEALQRLGAAIAELDAQMILERELCQNQLERGVTSKLWNADTKAGGEERLAYLFSLASHSGRAQTATERLAEAVLLASQSRGSSYRSNPVLEPVFERLKTRLRALEQYRADLEYQLASAAVEHAEAAWTAARVPADLEPAVRALESVRDTLPRPWSYAEKWRLQGASDEGAQMSANMGELLPARQPLFTEKIMALIDFWSVMANAQPFVLPDPTTDPAAFRKARETWTALAAMKHRLTTRPALGDYFRAQEARYREAYDKARTNCEAAMARNAPALELVPLLKAVTAFLEPEFAPAKPAFPPARPEPLDPDKLDYRLILAARTNPANPPQPQTPLVDPRRTRSIYTRWVRWVEARESGDSAALLEARDQLKWELDEWRGPLITTLKGIFSKANAPAEPPSQPQPAPDVAADPLEALQKGFEALAARDEALRPGIALLAGAWRQARDPEAGIPLLNVVFSAAEFWGKIAAEPEGPALFKLRDAAARAMLAATAAEEQTPIAALLAGRLEAAFAGGAWKEASHLLAISAAAALQTEPVRQASVQSVELAQKAAALQASGKREQAAGIYKSCIALHPLSGLGEGAAKALKALRAEPPKAPAAP